MPLEFALRPRIKIAEGFTPPRRSRWRVPRLALPIVAYWLTAGGITYALIHAHDQPLTTRPVAVEAAAPTEPPWWRPSLSSTATALEVAPTNAEPATSALATTESSPVSEEVPVANDAAADAARLTAPTIEPEEPRARQILAAQRRQREVADDAAESEPREARVLEAFPPLVPPPAPEAPLLGATPPDAPVAVANALPSCEAAAASANQEVDLAQGDRAPDLSREAIASVLDNGVWIARCDIPMTTSIDLCVAIRAGKAIGVSVISRPASAGISACVKRRAASLSFPFSARIDVAKTHF